MKPLGEGEIPFLPVPGFQREEANSSANRRGRLLGSLRPSGREAERRSKNPEGSR